MDAITSNLFVGALDEVLDSDSLREYAITTLVVLTHRTPGDEVPPEIEVVQIPMIDGPQNSQSTFVTAVSEVCKRLAADERVVVCCSAGASRSPAVAATALARQTDRSLPEAFQQVTTCRSEVDPHDALIRQAVSVYTES